VLAPLLTKIPELRHTPVIARQLARDFVTENLRRYGKAVNDFVIIESSRLQSIKHNPNFFQSPLFEAKHRTAQDVTGGDHILNSKVLLGQLEDDSLEEEEIIFENFHKTRTPARHKEQALNLVAQSTTTCKPPIKLALKYDRLQTQVASQSYRN
jgi:hypothetical protein